VTRVIEPRARGRLAHHVGERVDAETARRKVLRDLALSRGIGTGEADHDRESPSGRRGYSQFSSDGGSSVEEVPGSSAASPLDPSLSFAVTGGSLGGTATGGGVVAFCWVVAC